MILAHALLKIDIREKLPRPLVGSPHRSPRRMPSSRESCPPPKRHRVLQQPARPLMLGQSLSSDAAAPSKSIPGVLTDPAWPWRCVLELHSVQQPCEGQLTAEHIQELRQPVEAAIFGAAHQFASFCWLPARPTAP